MSKYNIQANTIGTVGDTNVYNYGASEAYAREMNVLLDELRKLQAAPSLQPAEKQELQGAVKEIEDSIASPDKQALKMTFRKLSPGLRTLLSSIGANLTSDVLVAAFRHAIKHIDDVRSLLG